MFPTKNKDAIVGNAENLACEMKDSITSAATQAGQKVRSLYNEASDDITHAGEKVTTEIRGNPVRSVVIALGVGAIIGALLRR